MAPPQYYSKIGSSPSRKTNSRVSKFDLLRSINSHLCIPVTVICRSLRSVYSSQGVEQFCISRTSVEVSRYGIMFRGLFLNVEIGTNFGCLPLILQAMYGIWSVTSFPFTLCVNGDVATLAPNWILSPLRNKIPPRYSLLKESHVVTSVTSCIPAGISMFSSIILNVLVITII